MSQQYQQFLDAVKVAMKEQSALKHLAEGKDRGYVAGEIQECHYLHEIVGGTEFLQFFLLALVSTFVKQRRRRSFFAGLEQPGAFCHRRNPTELTAADLAELLISMPSQWALSEAG